MRAPGPLTVPARQARTVEHIRERDAQREASANQMVSPNTPCPLQRTCIVCSARRSQRPSYVLGVDRDGGEW